MNLSIIARCERTGQIGLAAASAAIARGADIDGAAKPRVGAVLIQGVRSLRLNRLACNLLELGHSPGEVLAQLKRDDPGHAQRQIVVMNRHSALAAHEGAALRSTHALHVGNAFAVAGEGLKGRAAVDAALGHLEASSADGLDLRLLRALEAAAPALRADSPAPVRSAFMVVWGERDYSDLDLRADLHPDPVAELRRIYDDFKPTAVYYEERARNPSKAVSAREFAGILSQQRKASA